MRRAYCKPTAHNGKRVVGIKHCLCNRMYIIITNNRADVLEKCVQTRLKFQESDEIPSIIREYAYALLAEKDGLKRKPCCAI